MKRILFVHQTTAIGGGSYCLLNILREMDKTNIKPIACLPSEGPLYSEIVNMGIEVILFPLMCSIPYNRTFWSINSLKQYVKVKRSISAFKKLLESNQIDIVYLNNMMIYNYLKPAKECCCKTILHVREHWPLNEHRIQLQWAQNAVYKYVDELIAINNYSASIFPKKLATIVYDWVDMVSRYEPFSMNEILGEDASELKVYLYTGGIQPIKGALEILSTFVNDIKDSDARLLCLGLSPVIETVDLRGKIKKLLSSIGYQTYNWKLYKLMQSDCRVKCIPATYMLTDIMRQCYCNISFFTIPHANLTMVEAIIVGLPSVVAKNEESLEYSLNGEAAVLFEPNNKKDFLRAIVELSHNYDRYKNRLNDKSLEVEVMFNPQRNIKNLNNVIRRVSV